MNAGGESARHVLVGTAGHVDHGKTRLVEALTGIDCDRWAEEKRRGITIDIGFAHLEAEGMQLGFVDVPGHERFLHNALAGLGGIRLLLLVVAADEGIEPQTREHLAIVDLLGIPRAVVAVTKCDLVEEELGELAALEVGELLGPTRFAGSPVVRVSSATGRGLAELRAALLAAAREVAAPADPAAPARLPLDRAFHLRGLGVVVTGTLVSGAVRPGDQLALLPAGGTARVRSVQVHGAPRERAEAGERTALQLAGPELAELPRGAALATPGAFGASRRLVARLRLLPDAAPLAASLPVRFHLFSHEGPGRIRPLAPVPLPPGESGWVEIRLAAPVVAARGDRFVVRRLTPAATLGGGEIADPA
ncbi:MAG: selenocysteine-specific translation elongation factor, partial [Thermoanaerobaculia bacterium]|nr:selenocysteine-specific translation elongation factor [Thermoanaerobaculia bacterium]